MELSSRRATPKVFSPLTRFTTEFGMESEWFRIAKHTKKWFSQNPQDYIDLRKTDSDKQGQALGLLVLLDFTYCYASI